MRRRGERTSREKVEAETKSAERKAEQGGEEYQCTGILEQDFPELCAHAGIAGVPEVTLRPSPSYPADEEPPEESLPQVLARIQHKHGLFQPRVQVERDGEDPRGTHTVHLRGWKIEEAMLGVLSRCLPALAGLQAVHLWKVGLTEQLLPGLAELLARCPRLRTLSLEGNPLPEPAFHVLMGSDSTLAHLSLRNNGIGAAGAHLIGESLSTPTSFNRSLLSLVLSFNHISDLGAGYIAQGLRLNRSLLSLSLANNDIGDAGATRLAEVLGPFALSQAEVVEWRRLLLAEELRRSRTAPKETERPSKLRLAKQGKTPSKKELLVKEEARQPRKPPEPRAAQSKDRKTSGQEGPELSELAQVLLEARAQEGTVVLPGNRALLNLNLSHNRVTERGLDALLAALEGQRQEESPKAPGQQGLMCLSLENNRVPAASPAFARLHELLLPQDPSLGAQAQGEQPEAGK
ncbi:leucine-rich repeat-containing protein 71 [Nyctibius grandis]|uniref:leucine-rich repeat-containing protein 71 n=1 Tax=Nyctibius grandis TaxID=48427 RepID=UPI0035BC1319